MFDPTCQGVQYEEGRGECYVDTAINPPQQDPGGRQHDLVVGQWEASNNNQPIMLALLLLGDCANFDEESQVDSETTTTITTTAERGGENR